MKKILIIDLFSFQGLGGGQKYTRELIKILNKLNFNITILNFWNNENNDTKFGGENIKEFFIFNKKNKNKSKMIDNFKSLSNYICAKKYLKNFLHNHKFDIIIDNCTCISIDKKYKNKTIFIQHVDERILFNKYRNIVQKIFFIQPSFYNSYMNIVFTKNNKDIFTEKIHNSNNQIIPLFINDHILDSKNYKNSENYIAYIGRTDSKLKNFNLLSQISIFLDEKIHVIGNYSYALEKLKNNIIYDGEKANTEIMDYVLPNVKSIILTSDSEGLPFVVLEAFLMGKPVIVRDTFTNAKYLVTKERGLLIDKDMKPKDIAYIINNTDWNTFNSENIRSFVINEFSYANFENLWIDIFNKLPLN